MMASQASGLPRVAVVSVYFTLFDAQMPSDFRHRQEQWVQRLVDLLASFCDVVAFTGLITSEAEGRAASSTVEAAEPDVIVFAPPMAAPPSYAAAALAGFRVPVVLWNAPAVDGLGVDLDQAAAHEHTSMLGVLMYANVRRRAGLPFRVVTARPEDPAAVSRLERTIRAMAVAGSLEGAVILQIGTPYPGYLNIEATDAQLARIGVRRQPVTEDELQRTYDRLDDSDLSGTRRELEELAWQGDADPASLRLAAALRRLVDRHRPVAGAVNCHSPLLRTNPRIGVAACLGVSLCTAGGVPFACMADVPTAIALSIARRLAGRTLYCEFYAPEASTGSLLLANGGEGDAGWASGAVRIVPSSHYPGVAGRGSAVAFELEPGPATVISLSPIGDSWTLVWGCGEIAETRYPRMDAPNLMFRFDAVPAERALDLWLASGATHHNALAPGHLDLELEVIAETLALETRRI